MLSKTRNVLIISIVFTGLACIVYGGAWYAIVLRTHKVYEYMNETASRAEKQRSLASLSKTLAATKADREELEHYIIDDDRVTEFLGLVESSARNQGLKVSTKSVTVAALADDPSFEALTLALEVSGPFERVSAFLSLLETLPFQVQIGSVSLERISDESEDLWRGAFVLQVTKKKPL